MKQSTLTLLFAVTLLLLTTSAYAKLPDSTNDWGLANQITRATGAVAKIIQTEGFVGLLEEGISYVWDSFINWTQTVDFDLGALRLGLLTGGALTVLAWIFPDLGPFFQLSGFASKFSLTESATTLLTVVSKVNIELLHQIEGPLVSSKEFEKIINGVEKFIDIVSVPATLFTGNYYLLGLVMIDIMNTYILSKGNPFHE